MMKIVGVASAFPEHVYQQDEIADALAAHWESEPAAAELVRRIHARVGVKSRRLAFPLEHYPQFETWGQSNRAYLEVAEELGARAIDAALTRSGHERGEIDALYVVSVTGLGSPSLDARLLNRMGLRSDVKRTPIFGLGCVGGAVGVTRAADYVRAFPGQVAVLLSVEVCSLTIQLKDLSTANIIASGLFGDGAVAAVIADGSESPGGPEILSTKSVFYPDTQDIMGWDISEKGFRVVLSPKLSELVTSRFASDVDSFLTEHGIRRDEIGSWMIHPGGPKILEAVESALDLHNGELAASWKSLSRFGNLSSGSVLQVLEEVSTCSRPARGILGLIAAMGPGFCAELLLVRW